MWKGRRKHSPAFKAKLSRRTMKPRKLILSIKGFDTKAGGCPRPIFPDDTMYSLHIPSPGATIAYGDLCHCAINIGQVVEDLTR